MGVDIQSVHPDLAFTRTTLASAVLATERWLDGWLVVTHRYCVKTAKPILKVLKSFSTFW